jgi:sugar lactone lactonase YvrE
MATGALYVCESYPDPGHRNRLLKRDANGRWSELATQGRELGQFSLYARLKVDARGTLYVKDHENPRIQKRDPNGTWTVVTSALSEPGLLWRPLHVAVDSHGAFYVADTDRKQVQKRDAQGRWMVLLDFAKDHGDSHDVVSIAVDAQSNLYWVDTETRDWRNGRVMALDLHGEREQCMPTGTGLGQAQDPVYVAVDAADNLYVIDRKTDWGRRRLQRRDREGRCTVLAEAGQGPDPKLGLREFKAVAAAPNGNVYVFGIDSAPTGAQAFLRMCDAKGHWTTVATDGRELGQIGAVAGIATDSFGRFYVFDRPPDMRVQVRDLDGKWYALSDTDPGRPLGTYTQ